MADLLDDFLHRNAELLEQALQRRMPVLPGGGATPLDRAVRHALFPGGKRMRPLFTLAAAEVCGGEAERALPAACAVEFLHAASLVFDDLPCMDDAAERRGREPVHLAFPEGVALLAGLALFNRAYETLLECETDAATCEPLLRETARCVGLDGVIGGQAVELHARLAGAAEAPERHLRKTTGLTRLMCTAGALAAGAPPERVEALGRFGETFGRIYQEVDDVMDGDAPPSDPAAPFEAARRALDDALERLARSDGFDGGATLAAELARRAFNSFIARPPAPARRL